MKDLSILAIESSADETSAAVLFAHKKGLPILASNVVYSQMKIHQKTGGIVPEVAARNHIVKILPVIKEALTGAQTKLEDLDAIAVTSGPGLITSLIVGVDTAKALAFALDIPFIAVNHHEGHLLSALGNPLSISPLPRGRKNGGGFPAVGLVVSGGHTMLVLVKKIGRYKILGETLDDAAGEAFDKIAKIMGLPYPGGPEISRLAKKGNSYTYNFPRPMINSKNFDFSFSGLKTAVLYFWQDVIARTLSVPKGTKQSRSNKRLLLFAHNDEKVKADIAASVEQAIVDVLVSKTVRAAREFKAKTVLLGGGVSANEKLRKTLGKELKKQLPTSRFLIPDSSLTTDNAGMIAIVAYYKYLARKFTPLNKVIANPNLRLQPWNK